MFKLNVKIINESGYPLPEYATKLSAGFDLRSKKGFIPGTLEIGERILIPTGIKLGIPDGYELQIRSRSGLAHKQGIAVLNSPGTIDSDYRGEIFVNIINLSKRRDVRIFEGDRIAQAVLAPVYQASFEEVDKLDITERGEGGHGSTGTN